MIQEVLIFILFIISVVILYRFLKLALRALLVGVSAFFFPFIANYLSLPIPVTADIATGFQFAVLGIILFLIYNFFKYIKGVIKLFTKPFRRKK